MPFTQTFTQTFTQYCFFDLTVSSCNLQWNPVTQYRNRYASCWNVYSLKQLKWSLFASFLIDTSCIKRTSVLILYYSVPSNLLCKRTHACLCMGEHPLIIPHFFSTKGLNYCSELRRLAGCGGEQSWGKWEAWLVWCIPKLCLSQLLLYVGVFSVHHAGILWHGDARLVRRCSLPVWDIRCWKYHNLRWLPGYGSDTCLFSRCQIVSS